MLAHYFCVWVRVSFEGMIVVIVSTKYLWDINPFGTVGFKFLTVGILISTLSFLISSLPDCWDIDLANGYRFMLQALLWWFFSQKNCEGFPPFRMLVFWFLSNWVLLSTFTFLFLGIHIVGTLLWHMGPGFLWRYFVLIISAKCLQEITYFGTVVFLVQFHQGFAIHFLFLFLLIPESWWIALASGSESSLNFFVLWLLPQKSPSVDCWFSGFCMSGLLSTLYVIPI